MMMDPNSGVLEISSDEEVESGGVKDQDLPKLDWIVDDLFLDGDDVVKYLDGDSSDEVEFVREVINFKQEVPKVVVEDDDDDCVVLDGDPDKMVSVEQDQDSGSDELTVVGEKGQIACRDYPHPRHLCVKYPFSSTLHKHHCEQCHCFVCDSVAPCNHWGTGMSTVDHCHATDKQDVWKTERKNLKLKRCSSLPAIISENTSSLVPPVTPFQTPNPAHPLARSITLPHNPVSVPPLDAASPITPANMSVMNIAGAQSGPGVNLLPRRSVPQQLPGQLVNGPQVPGGIANHAIQNVSRLTNTPNLGPRQPVFKKTRTPEPNGHLPMHHHGQSQHHTSTNSYAPSGTSNQSVRWGYNNRPMNTVSNVNMRPVYNPMAYPQYGSVSGSASYQYVTTNPQAAATAKAQNQNQAVKHPPNSTWSHPNNLKQQVNHPPNVTANASVPRVVSTNPYPGQVVHLQQPSAAALLKGSVPVVNNRNSSQWNQTRVTGVAPLSTGSVPWVDNTNSTQWNQTSHGVVPLQDGSGPWVGNSTSTSRQLNQQPMHSDPLGFQGPTPVYEPAPNLQTQPTTIEQLQTLVANNQASPSVVPEPEPLHLDINFLMEDQNDPYNLSSNNSFFSGLNILSPEHVHMGSSHLYDYDAAEWNAIASSADI